MEVTLQDVTKRFDNVSVVEGLNLKIPEGALMMLLGPSGCGKTTTLRMVAGLEQPTTGDIYIGDRQVFGAGRNVAPERRRIGMVFQSYAVWPHMTVLENVAFPLTVRGVARRERATRALDCLRLVGLDNFAKRYPGDLSGGQQQRVALARAIVYEPDVLLLDEPLSNLDAKLRENMRFEIRDLQKRLGVTTLYVTHDQHEALTMSDIVAVMHGGHIMQMGYPREIYEQPNCRFVAEFVGWSNFFPIERLCGSRAVALGVPFECNGVPNATLGGEEMYLSIRPEDWVEVPPGATGCETNKLRVRLESVSYAGRVMICEGFVGKQRVDAHLVPSTNLRVASEIDLYVAPEKLTVVRG